MLALLPTLCLYWVQFTTTEPTMTITEIKVAIAKCNTLNALERLVRKNHQVLDVVFDVCEYWVYEALVLRIEGE